MNWTYEEDDYLIVFVIQYLCTKNVIFQAGKAFWSDSCIKSLFNEINATDKYIFFDMCHIEGITNRAFQNASYCNHLNKVLFFNVDKSLETYNVLQSDLTFCVVDDAKLGLAVAYNTDSTYKRFKTIKTQENYNYNWKIILSPYVSKKVDYLPSSGIYSNTSINLKPLFEKADVLKLVIGKLHSVIFNQYILNKKNVDCLIAASKNGIVLASILSTQLGIPAVYRSDIGQIYTHQPYADKVQNQSDMIIRSKNYLMIFDVMCLGTEAKLLNALVNVAGANLIGAIGVVCVQSPTDIHPENQESIIARTASIVLTKDIGINYRVALTKEELLSKDEEGGQDKNEGFH